MKIVEICGMYGAGKSTLHRQLVQRLVPDCLTLYRLPKFRNIHRLVLSAFRIAPIIWRAGLDSDWLKGFRFLVYLDVLAQNLCEMKDMSNKLLLYEEGPIMIHFVLRARVKKCRNPVVIDKELSRNLIQWSGVLDGVIWLDASDLTLVNRVRERHQRHMLKHCSLDQAVAFYKEYRSIYENILATCRKSGVPILCLSTEECDPMWLAARAHEFIASITDRRTISGIG